MSGSSGTARPAPGDRAELELRDLTVTFGGITALAGVGLALRPGQVHGVIGPNGAGKTTLFNVACGFVTPDTGTLWRAGEQVESLRPTDLAGLGIARTLQGLGLFDRMSVLDNVLVGADRHARSGFLAGLLGAPRAAREERELRERCRSVLRRLDIEQYADRLPPSLPYPVRKRVALARALVAEPRVLLLDEPASGLSSGEIDELGDLVQELAGHGGPDRRAGGGERGEPVAVLLVEHHMDLVMRICTEITVLDFGRVIAHGPPEQVRDDPAVLAAYLGEKVGEAAGDAR